MKRPVVTGAARIAGVVGRPIAHSLSPVIHGAWIADAGLDAAYVAFAPEDDKGFERLVRAFRGGIVRGLNVTAPFKEAALALSDRASEAAIRAGSANVLIFHADGVIEALTTDGEGMLAAFAEQAPGWSPADGPVAVLGAGGAARAAAAALIDAGCPAVRVLNRTAARAEELVFAIGGPIFAHALSDAREAVKGCTALINAAAGGPIAPLDALPEGAVVMDMSYRPLETPLLAAARAQGLRAVDGLAMLIAQARPSFQAFFGEAPPATDVRAVCLSVLESAS